MAAASLLAAGPSPAQVVPLGLVVYAQRAHLGEASASPGSSIYDGDRLSTDDDGTLRVAAPALTLHLNSQTALRIRYFENSAGSSAGTLQAELAAGTLIFSRARNAPILVKADQAEIVPQADIPTIGQVRVVGPKELRIYAQRGPLQFSYRGETDVIAEGAACRILLDPTDQQAVAASESGPQRKKPGQHRTTYLLIPIGVAMGIAIPLSRHDLESPDRPGPRPPRKPH